jgi:hypothetical protein
MKALCEVIEAALSATPSGVAFVTVFFRLVKVSIRGSVCD